MSDTDETVSRDATHKHDAVIDLAAGVTLGIEPFMRRRTRNTFNTLLYIGGALDPRRDMMDWNTLEPSGWVNRFTIDVSVMNPPGEQLRRVNVGHAFNPHRIRISFHDVDTGGWESRLSFFAWTCDGPDRVMVSAGEASGPWRWKLGIGRYIGTRPEDVGWTEKIRFWVPRDSIGVRR